MPAGQRPFMQLRHMTQPMLTISAVPEGEFLGAQQRGHDDVTAGAQQAVGLKDTRRRMPQVTRA